MGMRAFYFYTASLKRQIARTQRGAVRRPYVGTPALSQPSPAQPLLLPPLPLVGHRAPEGERGRVLRRLPGLCADGQ